MSNTTCIATPCDLNRVSADENREAPPWSAKFPVSIAALLAPAARVEPTDVEQRLKAAAFISLQLGGED